MGCSNPSGMSFNHTVIVYNGKIHNLDQRPYDLETLKQACFEFANSPAETADDIPISYIVMSGNIEPCESS